MVWLERHREIRTYSVGEVSLSCSDRAAQVVVVCSSCCGAETTAWKIPHTTTRAWKSKAQAEVGTNATRSLFGPWKQHQHLQQSRCQLHFKDSDEIWLCSCACSQLITHWDAWPCADFGLGYLEAVSRTMGVQRCRELVVGVAQFLFAVLQHLQSIKQS